MPNMNQPNAKGKTIADYLPMAIEKLMGGQRPAEQPVSTPVDEGAKQAVTIEPINEKSITEAIATLKDYKAGKANLESRIVEEERWWKLRHWDVVKGKNKPDERRADEARPEPTSAWMFNSLANKHADIMDNFPEPNVLPRERADEPDAQQLSSILPVVFERNEYEQTYSHAAWYKLKHGVCAKGVFWDKELENGLGDISIKFIDLLNIFWEPGITDLQSSRNLFVVSLMDNDLLEQSYPDLLKGKLDGQIVDVKQYVYDDNVDVSKKSVVVDWYYKRREGNRTILHLCKFVGNTILFASENDPMSYPNGFYEHGRYPIEFDVLFPEEGTPTGFGFISIMKSPQLYIDKLSQVMLENAMMSAKPRFMAKKNSGINEDEFLDWSKPIVWYEGDPNNIQPIQVQQVGGNVINILQMKIDELKETSSNRDVSQGSSSGGVTAAAAIAALQEAGNKTSRDMIAAGYRSFTQECYLAIELIRQFYDIERSFRITGETGQNEYIQFSNAGIVGKPLPAVTPEQAMQPGYEAPMRVPVFDIVVRPQKRSPYSKMAQNELAKELYQLGFFNPQMADQSLAALELMDFDGIEKVREKVQQGQTLMQQIMLMQQQMQQMAMQIATMQGGSPQMAQGGAPASGAAEPMPPSDGGGKSMGSAAVDAQKSTMTSYGQRLAERSRPSVQT